METSLTRTPARWTLRRLLTLSLAGAVVAWGGLHVARLWRYRFEIGQIDRDMNAHQYVQARERLVRLEARWPGRDEVEYALGACEAELGHVNAALAAWTRVPSGSSLRPRAAFERANLALEHGRLAAAEESLLSLKADRNDADERIVRLVERLMMLSGRSQRIAALIEGRWPRSGSKAQLLRTHWLVETQPLPIGVYREMLDRMGREAPEDDRVWLARADLATRTGDYEAAGKWLQRCLGRRPDDPDVWEACLALALSDARLDDAIAAAKHLPAGHFRAAEIDDLAARIAALQGDDAHERAALERRVALSPGDSSAWDRLAQLAARRGESERAAEFRRRKAEIDVAKDRYRTTLGQLGVGDVPEMRALARTAETLGRSFEARGWWALWARQSADDQEARAAIARLDRPAPPAPAAGQTVADLIASLEPRIPPARQSLAPALTIPQFRDDAEASGLRFVYDQDPTPLRRLPETMGGGLGVLDYDGDGWLDVYAVQGGRFPSGETSTGQGDRLFRNQHDGTFQDVTERTGIAAFPRGFGHGVAVGDYDNDGHPDLFVTRWRSYALYRNKGDGTFEDATAPAGLGGDRDWPTSAAFGDLDNDGDLDLYVCHYLAWDPRTSSPCLDPERPSGHLYCVPRGFEAKTDHVFRNDGGRYVDVSAEAGIVDRDHRGLGVVIADLDDDGRADIFVANDMTANLLYHNLGSFHFEEVGQASGAASNADGGFQAGMGIACGDLDGDGRLDLAVTNFYGESTTYFQNLGGGLFADRTNAVGLAAPTRHVLGFGAFFLDANNDGRLDLAIANGHVNDYHTKIPYAMPAQLFLGTEGPRLVDVSQRSGACWSVPRVGRGLAVADLDNDGRQDVLILNQGEPLAFLHNLGNGDAIGGPAHFLTLRLEGTRSNRDAVGARVRLRLAGRTQTTERIGGGSFLSACDGRLHFGLGGGKDVPVANVDVHWPSGQSGRYEGLRGDEGYHLVEGDPRARPLEGWPTRKDGPGSSPRKPARANE